MISCPAGLGRRGFFIPTPCITMGTRSAIGYLQPSGSVRAVFCHWDGCPSHQLPILNKHYNTTSKVKALVKPGFMSHCAPVIPGRLMATLFSRTTTVTTSVTPRVTSAKKRPVFHEARPLLPPDSGITQPAPRHLVRGARLRVPLRLGRQQVDHLLQILP